MQKILRNEKILRWVGRGVNRRPPDPGGESKCVGRRHHLGQNIINLSRDDGRGQSLRQIETDGVVGVKSVRIPSDDSLGGGRNIYRYGSNRRNWPGGGTSDRSWKEAVKLLDSRNLKEKQGHEVAEEGVAAWERRMGGRTKWRC